MENLFFSEVFDVQSIFWRICHTYSFFFIMVPSDMNLDSGYRFFSRFCESLYSMWPDVLDKNLNQTSRRSRCNIIYNINCTYTLQLLALQAKWPSGKPVWRPLLDWLYMFLFCNYTVSRSGRNVKGWVCISGNGHSAD